MIRFFAVVFIILTALPAFLFADASQYRGMFTPLPEVKKPQTSVENAQRALGKRLYFETRMSKNNKLSCNSCHDLGRYGVDNEPTSLGHEGKRGDRNSPTVYNAFFHVAQFWDGRAKDVEEQALGPILNPVEMGMASDVEVLKVLKADPTYVKEFKKAFPEESDPLTYENVGKAIGAFERTLVTPSRFDAWLKGDDGALTDSEKKGVETFVMSGCTTCHNGVGLGGHMFQKLGLVHPYETKDLGRFQETKVEADKYIFKVPSLRNISKTGPYFHDGSVESLEESVQLMGWHQLGRKLSEKEIDEIVAFLSSLTGDLPEFTG